MADIFDSAISKRPYNGHELNNLSFDQIVAGLLRDIFNNSKFSQNDKAWFEILAETIKKDYARALFDQTTKFAEKVIAL